MSQGSTDSERHSIISNSSQPADNSEEFKRIISDNLLPIIHDIFKTYVDDPSNFLKPTNYLNTKLKENNYENKYTDSLRVLEKGFNSIYEVGQLVDSGFNVVITINPNSFLLTIVPLDNYQNDVRLNNLSFSPDRKLGMYIYGVKANGIGPKISGNVFNTVALDICKLMHISQLYISDSAGIKCYWDESIELQHFSILRVMVGKPTFYASLPGHFYNQDKAMEEMSRIQQSITSEERDYILHYLDSLKTNSKPTSDDDCKKIQDIIDKGIQVLGEKPEIFRYVAIPYTGNLGGKRNRKTKRKRIRKTKTKRNRKTKRVKSRKTKRGIKK